MKIAEFIKRPLLYLFMCFIVTPLIADEKLLIFTYSFNRPDFIEVQYQALKKYLKDDFEYVVFNDAIDLNLFDQIHQTCDNLNVRCIDIPQGIHQSTWPSARNGAVVDYSLDFLGYEHDGILVLLDSDLFLVREFSIKDYLADYALAGLKQVKGHVDYLWIGLVFIDMSKIPNKTTLKFSPGTIKGVGTDAGGSSHYYLSENPNIPVRYMNQALTDEAYKILTNSTCLECNNSDSRPCEHVIEKAKAVGNFDDKQIQYILKADLFNGQLRSVTFNSEFFIDSNFFHYRAGTNWHGQTSEFCRNKNKHFNEYIESILND